MKYFKKNKLNKISFDSGDLTFLESNKNIPFEIKRIFYMYNLKYELSRGAHAHKMLHQFIVPISGNFYVSLNDGIHKKEEFFLSKPNEGLYIPPMTWTDLYKFSIDAIVLVLASDFFFEDDYIRNFDSFLEMVE